MDELFCCGYALAKQIPDMELRGFSIMTSFGDVDLRFNEQQQVTKLVKKLITKRHKELEKKHNG